MEQPSMFTVKKYHKKAQSILRSSLDQPLYQQNTQRSTRYNNKDVKHKSIYSLSVESRNLINSKELSSNVNKIVFRSKEAQKNELMEPISLRQISQLNQSTNRQLKLQRYSKEGAKILDTLEAEEQEELLYSNTKQQVGLLRRIIKHYKIKSLQQTYYSNLVNNLGMKITNGFESKNQIHVKGSLKYPNKCRKNNSTINQPSINSKNMQKLQSIDIDQMFKPHQSKGQQINKDFRNSSMYQTLDQADRMSSTIVQGANNKSRKDFNQSFICNSSKKQTINRSAVFQNLQTCITQKVNKYKQFIFIVNMNHGVYRDLDVVKYERPFKIFLGKGNNSNLIRSLMKKRFWFEETKCKKEANFVWSQLKEQCIFNTQRSLTKQQEVDKAQKKMSIIRDSSDHTNLHHLHQTAITLTSNFPVSQQKTDKIKKQPLRKKFKTFDTDQPHNKLCTKQQTQAYNQLMDHYTYKKKILFSQRLKYMKHVKVIQQEQFYEVVIQNHLPLNGLLGNKKAMFYMLRQYYRLTSRNIFQCVPLTYHIKKGTTDPQYLEFSKTYTESKNQSQLNYWIIKPGQFSNRGQGISCTNKIEDVRNRVDNLKKLGRNKSLIVQQYIANPMLYNGRKFDIRTFMLISTNNGFLRAYWYQDGYVRTSSYIWKLEEITDPLIHLTNDAIQKNCDDYGKFQPGNKLTYSELQRYLDTLPRPNSRNKKFNFMAEIYPKIRQVAIDAVKATFNFLDKDRKGSNFQIFGFDFMIDSNFKPWLIEINTNPCLELNCPILERIIPSMVENALRIGLDPVFPPPLTYSATYKYNIPENAINYNKFQLIFDQKRDGPSLIQLYDSSDIMERMEDYEQDKETYEQEGEEIILQ